MPTEDIEAGSFSPKQPRLLPRDSLRILSWNINRGCCFDQILDFLCSMDADLILLQECDRHALRSGRRNVTREIAQTLRMDYVFGVEFEELSQGDNFAPAHHGQATLCRWPMLNPRVLRFAKRSSFWKPRWFIPRIPRLQRRVGGRMALVCEIPLSNYLVLTYNLHLESRNSDELRRRQLSEVLADAERYPDVPVLIAGDFNMDVRRSEASAAIRNAGFRNPFTNAQVEMTTQQPRVGRPRAIDWMLFRGQTVDQLPRIHTFVPGSDHLPLSTTLSFS